MTVPASMTPYWLRQMADWFDAYQSTIRKLGSHPPGTVITPGTEMQVLLRGWADDLERVPVNGAPARVKVTHTPEPKERGFMPGAAFTFEFLDESGAPYPPGSEVPGFDPDAGYEAVYVQAAS